MYEVHVVFTESDIHGALTTQDVFIADTEGLQIIFLNCGATTNIFSSVGSEDLLTVHILDSHGPVSLELLASKKATNLHIWDAGSTQTHIERFFRRIIDDRDKPKQKRRRHRGDAPTDRVEPYNDESDGKSDASDNEKSPFERYASLSLTDEEKLLYYTLTYSSETPSAFLFKILTQLRVTVADDVIWYRAVALTAFHFNELFTSASYTQSIAKLQAIVGVSQRNKSKLRAVSVPNAANADLSEQNMVGSYHNVQIETNLDTPLLLLHHWTLWEAIRNSPHVSQRLQLFEGKTLCKQRIYDIFAHLGITQKESNAKWTELSSLRRADIQKLLLTENVINSQPLCRPFRSISKRHGYGYICGAADMVRLLQCVLTELTPNTTGEKANEAYETSTYRANFFSAIEVLRSVSMSAVAKRMASCCSFFSELVEMTSTIHQKNLIKSTKTFDYVLLQDEDLPSKYLQPLTLRILSEYLIHLPVQRKTPKNRPPIFILGVLDRASDEFLFLGAQRPIVSTESKSKNRKTHDQIHYHFHKLSLKYPDIITHNGIDKDWIRVRREHCLHIIDAIHVDVLSMRHAAFE